MILSRQSIDFQWPVQDPFLFCVHHLDHYPAGNKNYGLDSHYFPGRQMGSDFVLKDGFRLYHGREVPGFPAHPHRGFETITITRKGYVDHADSLGAAGRYGEGDVQWMTAGAGIEHSEMFPLLHQDRANTVELFQIWLNLPKINKLAPAEFKMLWSHSIPKIQLPLGEVSLICGNYQGERYYEAPHKSWARDPGNEVNILLVKLRPGGEFHYPASRLQTNRTLYFFEGEEIEMNGVRIASKQALFLNPHADISIRSSSSSSVEFLLLEAKPIAEAVVQYGPFVMNTREEIAQAMEDYGRTQFGGHQWPRRDMIHGGEIKKFAKYPDGKIEKPHF
jgi:quercetin 2,3-dioxygenase